MSPCASIKKERRQSEIAVPVEQIAIENVVDARDVVR